MKKLSNLNWMVLLLVSFSVSCKESPVTIYKDNPHYFFFHGKPVVFITSDHHYGAVIDRDFDYKKFLDNLADKGMNLTRIYPGGMFEPADKYLKGNPLGPKQGRQLLPWARSQVPGANPQLAEQGKQSLKFDLEKWNPEYFNRLKDFVNYAAIKGIIVEIPFFNGMYWDCWPLMAMYHQNNIQNAGNYEANECGLFTSADPRNRDVIRYQKAYIAKITSELNGFDNLIYDICDEPSLQGLQGGNIIFLPDSQVIPWINEMKEAFLLTEKSLPKKHLLGQTVQNLSPDMSENSWCEWLPAEYVKPAERALTINYKNNKPLVDVESNYYGMSLTKNEYTSEAIRLEGWWFMLAGGAGCINLNGEFYRGHEEGGQNSQSYILPQKRTLKKFMDKLELKGLSRSTTFSTSLKDGFCNVLAGSGKQYALYIFHGAYETEWGAHFISHPGNYLDTIRLINIPAGHYSIDWIDPATGSKKFSERIEWNSGDLVLTTPIYTVDIAMLMKKR